MKLRTLLATAAVLFVGLVVTSHRPSAQLDALEQRRQP
jgi:hypothetical protein